MILGLKKGQSNSGSFKKGEHRSSKTEFKKDQIPHNKGKKGVSEKISKNISIAQKKRFQSTKQSKEEKNRKNREYQRKKRAEQPEIERENERIYRLKPGVRENQNKKARERHAKNPEKYRKKGRVYYQKHKEEEKLRFKKYLEKHEKEIKQRILDLTIEVYSHYSKVISNSDVPVCACVGCGIKNIEFLELDHINGRKSMNHGPSLKAEKLCRRLRRDSYPKGIQILCSNCNHAKRDNEFCPVHQWFKYSQKQN